MTSALAVFETNISKAFNDGRVDKQEFTTCEMFHLGVLSELASVNRKMKAKTRTHMQKSTGRVQQPKEGRKEEQCLMMCTLFSLCYLMC